MTPRVGAARPYRFAAALAGLLLLVGCAQATRTTEEAGQRTARLTVLAAASLTEAFETLGAEFEEVHPGTEVTFSFGSSATLASQIVAGAPADVFAAANEATMQQVIDAGAGSAPAIFAVNTLQIAVPPTNPGKIVGLADFGDEAKRIAVCAPQVPCGSATAQVLAAAGVTPAPDTLESDVKAALQKVRLNEVDAALVYRSDVITAGSAVRGIAVPEAARVPNRYPVCALRGSRHAESAADFVSFVRSRDGQAALRKAGFGVP